MDFQPVILAVMTALCTANAAQWYAALRQSAKIVDMTSQAAVQSQRLLRLNRRVKKLAADEAECREQLAAVRQELNRLRQASEAMHQENTDRLKKIETAVEPTR